MTPHLTVDREGIEAFYRKWKVKELSLFGSVPTDDQVANLALQCSVTTI